MEIYKDTALTPGQVVFSKSGRDKGKIFTVLYCADGFAYLADGKIRTVKNPKKKKLMHVQKTNEVLSEIKREIESGGVSDSDIVKGLKQFQLRRV